jgi:hypothetical protein
MSQDPKGSGQDVGRRYRWRFGTGNTVIETNGGCRSRWPGEWLDRLHELDGLSSAASTGANPPRARTVFRPIVSVRYPVGCLRAERGEARMTSEWQTRVLLVFVTKADDLLADQTGVIHAEGERAQAGSLEKGRR